MTAQSPRALSRIVQFTEFGEPDVMKIVEVEAPFPGNDEVLVRMKAIGLNRSESMIRRNEYIVEVSLPSMLGSEGAGVVEAIGKNVTNVKVGDRVAVVHPFGLGTVPIYGDEAVVPKHTVIVQPDFLSFEEAASLWVMLLTPYGALIEDAKIQPGEFVLISAASSSTGIGAIQLANMAGAIPIALTRTSAKRQQLLDAGARHVVAFEEVDLVAEIMALTDGQGARVAFDAVGGELLPKLTKAMALKGTLYVYGWLGGSAMVTSAQDQIARMLTTKGWTIVDTLLDPDRLKAATEFVIAGLAEGILSPVIDRVFAFEEIVEANRYLEASQQIGKIVAKVEA
jgi:NADPH:quinone reductase-like Zn-dependent oxidoreductase